MLRCHNDFRKRRRIFGCTPSPGEDCYEYYKNPDGSFVDSECAADDEINDWLKDKVMFTKFMNQQIDFHIHADS